jgi:hypothetical protein
MTGAILLITTFLFGAAAGAAVAGVTALAFGGIWYALPLRRRRRLLRERG